MKRSLIYIMLMLFLAGCTAEVDETPLYSRYSARQDIAVAQVSGFQLNDSVKVDAVILVADDTAAWLGLKEEFDIRASAGVTSWMGDIDEPRQRVRRSDLPAWRVVALNEERTIAFYRIGDSVQYQALLDYQLDNMIKDK